VIALKKAASQEHGQNVDFPSFISSRIADFPNKIVARRDGRVVDGGGLEKRIGRFAEFANSFAKSARHAR
jgi:hypothetical protein